MPAEQQMNTVPRHRKIALALGGMVAVIVVALVLYSSASGPSESEKSLAEREIERLEGRATSNPFDYDLQVQLAIAYVAAGRYGDAVAAAQAILAEESTHQSALLVLGIAYIEQKRYRDAESPFLKILELNKGDPMAALNEQFQSAHYNLGVIYLELNEPQKALRHLHAAAEVERGDADSRYKLAEAYRALGNCEKAVEHYKEAVRFVPNFKEAYVGLAGCYEALGNATGTQYAKAMISYSSGDYASAVRTLQSAVATDPDYLEAHLALGLTYEKLRRPGDAITAYESVIRLDAENWLANARLDQLR